MQVILSTHSPLILSEVPRDSISRLSRSNIEHEDDESPEILSFCAPVGSIYNYSFNTPSTGIHGHQILQSARDQLEQGCIPANVDYLGSIIDDDYIKSLMDRAITTFE